MHVKAWSRHHWPAHIPLDVLWKAQRSVMRGLGSDTGGGSDSGPSECILVVGVSRPKIAAAFLTVALLSLFLTFHMLYDSAVYSLRAAAEAQRREQLQRHHHQLGSISARPVRAVVDSVDSIRTTFRGSIMTTATTTTTTQKAAKSHFPKTNRQLPQAIIVGVRKCGTRALLEMLFLHPQIQKAAGEVHFFDRDDNYEKGLEWYRKKMPYSFHGQITIEKSPSYFVTPQVPERIRAMNSSVRLLLIVREPVTRAISDYAQLRSHAATATSPLFNTSNYLLSNSIPQEPPGKSFEELVLRPDGSVNEAYRPIAISMYAEHMSRWLGVFERRQMLVVNGDQLIDDPVPQLKRIESFLRLEPRIGRHNFYFNRTKGFYCMRNDTEEKCLRDSKGRRHPRVRPSVLAKLRAFFAEHNQRFYELVGEHLGWPEQ